MYKTIKEYIFEGFICQIRLFDTDYLKHYCGYISVSSSDLLVKYMLDEINDCSFHGGVSFYEITGNQSHHVWGYDCRHAGDTIEKQDLQYNIKVLETVAKELTEMREKLKVDLEINPEKYL